jgi:3-hydroxyisobutyrate dehydrogenase
MVGHGHDNVDFSILLQETAVDAGLKLVPENVKISDGLEG